MFIIFLIYYFMKDNQIIHQYQIEPKELKIKYFQDLIEDSSINNLSKNDEIDNKNNSRDNDFSMNDFSKDNENSLENDPIENNQNSLKNNQNEKRYYVSFRDIIKDEPVRIL